MRLFFYLTHGSRGISIIFRKDKGLDRVTWLLNSAIGMGIHRHAWELWFKGSLIVEGFGYKTFVYGELKVLKLETGLIALAGAFNGAENMKCVKQEKMRQVVLDVVWMMDSEHVPQGPEVEVEKKELCTGLDL